MSNHQRYELMKAKNNGSQYSNAHQRFIDLYRGIDVTQYDPYPIDWIGEFSPIEYSVWCEIRNYGFPFWPQYPIEMYRADFADVEKKIIIECDGKQYHNKEADSIRDSFLKKLGWRVFRINGSDCNRTIDEDYEIFEAIQDERISPQEAIKKYSDWLKTTAGGLLACLAFHYYGIRHVSMKSILSETLENLSGDVLFARES